MGNLKPRRMSPWEYKNILQSIGPTTNGRDWQKYEFYHEAYNTIVDTGLPNYLQAKIQVPSGLKYDAWEDALRKYKDKEICQYLRYGWPTNYTADTPPTSSPTNHSTSLQYPRQIQEFLKTEVELGGLLRPFHHTPFKP